MNLLLSQQHVGAADTAEMVAARAEFLAASHFAPIAQAVSEELRAGLGGSDSGVVAEVGAGTGYYLAQVLDALPAMSGVALDISKHAARYAARSHEHTLSVVSDAWGRLPLRDASVRAVLSVFAPRNVSEFARVLTDGGVAVVVTPQPEHLCELVQALGLLGMQEDKGPRVEAAFDERFELVSRRSVSLGLALTRREAVAVAGMGPSAQHVPAHELAERTAALAEPVGVTAAVEVRTFRLR